MSDEQIQMTDSTAMMVVLARCYDLLAVIARYLDPELAEEILDEHGEGGLRMPFPYLRIPADE